IDIPGGLILEGSPAGLREDAHPVGIQKNELTGLGVSSQRHEFVATSRFVVDGVIEGRVEMNNLPKNAHDPAGIENFAAESKTSGRNRKLPAGIADFRQESQTSGGNRKLPAGIANFRQAQLPRITPETIRV